MSRSTTSTKRSAEAAAEAAPLALPEQTAAGAVRSAVMSATSFAEHLAAASKAAAFVAEVGAAAWSATLAGRRSIGEAMFGAHVVKLVSADAEAAKPQAADVTFTALMASLYSVDKSGYEALARDKRVGPGKRSWSALAEDFACFVNTFGDVWYDGYMLSIGDDVPTIRGYTTFARRAAAEQTAASERGETPQMAGARTKRDKAAAAAAEVERQAAARKAAADTLVTKREAEAEAAQNRATAILRHVSEHPSASLVAGVPGLSCAEAAALSVSTLRALAEAAMVLADKAEADAASKAEADKAASKAAPVIVADVVTAGQTAAAAALAAQPDTEAEVAAIGAAAEAAQPDALSALAEQVAAITAALAAMAAAK